MANLQAQLQQALAAHQQGNLAVAESAYRKILGKAPKHFDALHLLGVLCAQQGQFAQAIDLIQRALKVNPGHAGAYSNLGNAQLGLGHAEAALVSYDRALKTQKSPDLLFNRGNALKGANRFSEALASYDQALALMPAHADALINRGHVLQALGRQQEALTSYEAALAIKPHTVNALVSYAHLQQQLGHFSAALQAAKMALGIEDSINTRSTFFNIVKTTLLDADESIALTPLLIRAMSEPWGRPYELVPTFIRLVRQDAVIQRCMARASQAWPQPLPIENLFADNELFAVARHPGLLCLLENALATDLELEKFLTLTRNVLLQAAASTAATAPIDPDVLHFFCALARQCFINEYVFYCPPDEFAQAEALARQLDTTLLSGATVSPLWIAAVACYFPLHSQTGTARMRVNSLYPAPINALLLQQVEEPLQEKMLAGRITCVTPVNNSVSQQVQQQYEENPYPRWIKYAPQRAKTTLAAYLKETFPHAPFSAAAENATPDYLIAGCGTGQQAIDVALNFQTSRIVAVDLSMTSLGYAARKAAEFAISNIEYAQADIMELGTTGWQFDAMESVGVLHHLADPVAGWRVLLSMLRMGGFMKLGFYSEIARRNMTLNTEHPPVSSAEDIRHLRQQIMLHSDDPQYADMLAIRDFYSTSECRDLLFHVQEHRFNLPRIKQVLAELGLTLLGFQLSQPILRQYAQRFPDDASATNLDYWHIFEQENPDTFIGMYQFWVQKTGAVQ